MTLYAPPDAPPEYMQSGNCPLCGVWLHGRLKNDVFGQHMQVVHPPKPTSNRRTTA